MTDTAEKQIEDAKADCEAEKARALKTWQDEAAERSKQLANLEDRARRIYDRKYDDLATYQERCELLLAGSETEVKKLQDKLGRENDPVKKAAIQKDLTAAVKQRDNDERELRKAASERNSRKVQVNENKSLQSQMNEWMAERQAQLEQGKQDSDKAYRDALDAAEKKYRRKRAAILGLKIDEPKGSAMLPTESGGGVEFAEAKRQEHAELVKEHERLWGERSAAFTRLIAATNRLSEPINDPKQREQAYRAYTAANDAHEAIAAQCNEHSKKLAGFVWV